MIPIVVSTLGCRSLSVFQTSVKTYNPDVDLIIIEGKLGSFGSDFNYAMEYAFQTYNEIIIANDDIVLTPNSYIRLLEDVEFLKNQFPRSVGLVAARSDYVRQNQSIANGIEPNIIKCTAVSPLFAYISKEAFSKVQFPPINWLSDDILCKDLAKLGYQHFVSRSYIHHVGSQTMGMDFDKIIEEPKKWIKTNRSEYFKEWYE